MCIENLSDEWSRMPEIDFAAEHERLQSWHERIDQRFEANDGWAKALTRDFELLRPHLGDGGEADGFADLVGSMWTQIDCEYDEIAAEYALADAAFAVLVDLATSAGFDLDDLDADEDA